MRTLARSRFGWERTLDDLTRVIPRGVALSSVVGTRPEAAADAAATGAGAVTLTLEGCLPSQADVPELLSRLETIRGVRDVALNTSDAAAQAEGAGCTGTAPTFEVVLTFGATESPADPSAATAAPTPGAGA